MDQGQGMDQVHRSGVDSCWNALLKYVLRLDPAHAQPAIIKVITDRTAIQPKLCGNHGADLFGLISVGCLEPEAENMTEVDFATFAAGV